MPNIASALKAEIGRVARKELRGETDPLKKTLSQYRTQIAALKRRIEALERQQKQSAKLTIPKASEQSARESSLRFRPSGFAAHRKRLGLSAREMGLLLDASALSVYKWESGQARPRSNHLEAIADIRKLGKREAAKRLDQLNAS
jgi:DNA-binding transcriptional regulator YiaG